MPAVAQARLTEGIWTCQVRPLHLRWSGVEQAREVHGRLVPELMVPPGVSHDLVLELSDQPLPDQRRSAENDWSATKNQWRRVVPVMETAIGRRDARHATPCWPGWPAFMAAWWQPPPRHCPRAAGRAATTITGSAGFVTSALQARRWRPMALISYWTPPLTSSPTNYWRDGRHRGRRISTVGWQRKAQLSGLEM